MASYFHSPLWKAWGKNWSKSHIKSTHAIQHMFFINTDVDKQFINFWGFSTGQANFSVDITDKVVPGLLWQILSFSGGDLFVLLVGLVLNWS